MSETSKPEVGAIGWADLTVENADEVRYCVIQDPAGAVAALYQPKP